MHSSVRQTWIARVVSGMLIATAVVLPAGGAQAAAEWTHAAAWGDNGVGQLGDGSQTSSPVPVAVLAAGYGFTKVAAGDGHNVAIGAQGTVWTWGGNHVGQLGDGTTTSHPAPVKVPGLIGVVDVAAGSDFTLALASNGQVWGWGNNFRGQVGDGTTVRRLSPVRSTILSGVTQITAGLDYALALRGDGSALAWGENSLGQLGIGSYDDQVVPTVLPTLNGIAKISAGGRHALALRTDGSVWGWGYGWDGQVGDGTQYTRPLPVNVLTSEYTDIAAGSRFSLGIRVDGRLMAWGDNSAGQLGLGTTEHRLRPTKVTTLPATVTAVSAGGAHSLVAMTDGTAWSSGSNDYGQLGTGPTGDSLVFTQIPNLTSVTQVSAAFRHSLAIREVPKPTYTIEVVFKNPTVPAGGTVTAQITTTALNGSVQELTLTPTTQGIPATITPATVQAGAQSTLTLTVPPQTPPGTYQIKITGKTTLTTVPSATISTIFPIQVTRPE
ncbi:RCC1 domain-containing protein [Acrocarpospora catenulata]|uniref:RCC1 domain-containing protein n=1 Tax=Acrocarpospora catenulata TaxID=2836182 RepID=UPI001BDB52B1|nr:hypothetical protein [Acrocarpospora catenulata]